MQKPMEDGKAYGTELSEAFYPHDVVKCQALGFGSSAERGGKHVVVFTGRLGSELCIGILKLPTMIVFSHISSVKTVMLGLLSVDRLGPAKAAFRWNCKSLCRPKRACR